MVTKLDQWRESAARRRRRAERANYRLDIQGLRAVAVIAVLAVALTGWPRGGFVGIDVFFVITGYFVTESLLRATAESGRLSLSTFYWDRARRIVPAAVLVLILTVAATALARPSDTTAVGVDALFGLLFVANWHFAAAGTDPWGSAETASPLLHYWPLSVEEQFLIVWPLIVLGITAVAVRSAWSDNRWRVRIGAAMGVLAVASLTWAVFETMGNPSWAYFSTFARAWEFGVGALLATAAGTLSRIPDLVRPILSWAGLALLGAALVVVDGSTGFPAPWALLPVAGTALVIVAGIGREPDFQGFLRNRVSTYLGDISYSLYLVHWPVIVLLTAFMARDVYYYASALTLMFGLALLSYHLVENPARYFSWAAVQQARSDMRHGLFHPKLSTKVGAVAGLVLITLCVISYAMSGDAIAVPAP